MSKYYVMCKVVKNVYNLNEEWYKTWERTIMHDKCYKKLENAQKRADEMNKKNKSLHFYVIDEMGKLIDDCKNYGGEITNDN